VAPILAVNHFQIYRPTENHRAGIIIIFHESSISAKLSKYSGIKNNHPEWQRR